MYTPNPKLTALRGSERGAGSNARDATRRVSNNTGAGQLTGQTRLTIVSQKRQLRGYACLAAPVGSEDCGTGYSS